MPIYNLNNQVYDIPDDVVKDFERDNPNATIAYQDGEDVYDIPVNKRDGFLKQFPNAKPYQEPGENKESDPFDTNVERAKNSEPIQRVSTQSMIDAHPELGIEREEQLLIDENEIQRLKNLKMNAEATINTSSFFDRFFNPETRAAVAARDKVEEALETYQEANRNDDNWVEKNVGGVLRGIFDKVGDLRTWDFGASGVASAVALKDAVEKLDNGEELTPAEQNMLDAFGLSAAVQSAYQDKVGTAYNVGGSLPESASFMASLALNPAGGVGRKIAEKAAKSAVKKYGTTLVGKLAKGAARVGGDIVEMGVATAVPGAGRVAEDYYNRLNGQSTFDVDDNGLIRYGGQVEQEEADDAIWKAFGSQFIENYSEAMGNYFAPMGNILSNLTSKGLKAAHLGKVAEAISDISSSQWSKGIQRFKDAVKFDGLVGEYMEEVAGNVMNAATVGDMNFNAPDDPRSVFNPETNIETFLSCALMSGTMYAVEAPVTLYNKYIPKRNLRNADNTASELLGNRWEDLRNQIDEADLGHMAQILTGVENATDLSLEQKQAIKNYASKLVQYQAYNSRKVQDAQEATPEANEAENAYNEGTENTTHEYVFAANRAKVKAENALKQADESVYNALNEAMATGQPVEAFLNSLNGDVATLARDYYNKELRVRGTLDAVKDKAEEEIARETKIIKSVSDPKTGIYAEVNRIDHDEQGNEVLVPGYITGWIGEGENRTPIFLEEGAENTQENRKPLKPSQYKAEAIQEMPMDEVISVMTSMIRDNAAKQAEQEAKYAPDVLNAQMQQGIPFEDETAVYVPFQVTPEGNAWIVDIYAKDENGNQSKKPTRTDVVTNDQFRDILQAQYEANEAAQQQSVQEIAPTTEAEVTNTPVATEEVAPTEDVQPEVVEEVQQPQQQAPVIPTKEDGSIDFVSYGKDNTFKTLGEKYGEKMPNKVAVTAKALAEDLVKAQEKLAKAEEAYDNAPIGREQKAEQARDKAKAELESIQREADFWSSLDNEIKEAQAKRDALLNPKADIDMSEEPMSAEEFIAQQLANGNIALESASYKKETGYGEKERQKFIKMFRKAENGGMTIESAGDLLMQMDRENGTNFFDQTDANAGRDALINFLGSVSSWGDVTGYIRNNREAQAAKEAEGLRNEMEDVIEENYHMTPEEYATLQEIEATENPFEGVDIEAKDAIFAEAALEYEEYLKSLENGQGTTEEVIEGNGDVLSEEQSDNSGGTEQRQGEGLDVSEGTVQSDDAAQEESAEVEEGNTPFRQTESILEQAERIANEEARRNPLRQRAKEWEQKLGVKVNIIETFDDVTNKDAKRAIRDGQRVTGWYEESTGEVCLYMPYLESAQEIDATYIHEVVAHKGLRGLLGDKFDEFLDDVWNAMSEADKLIYLTYPGVNGNKRAAADEYIAHLAENIDVTESAWGKLAELIKKFLKAIGLEPKMTHADIANTIKLSYQRLLSGEGGVDVVGDGTRFSAKKKRALETVSASRKKHHQTAISSADGAKILNNLDNLAEKYENDSYTKEKTFIGYLSDAIEAVRDGSNSRYATFETRNGKVVTIRLADHNATVSNFDYKGEEEGISIIVTSDENYGIINDGNAHIVEFYYNAMKLRRADGKPLAEIVKSIKQSLYSGEYKDTTGLAERQEVNGALFRVKDKNELVAVHNISEDNLRKVLEVGSLVMPSIAITKVDMGHEGYGEISLLFDKETINPSDRRNKVYGGDAWTPRFPQITPKINEKVSSNAKKKIYELIEDRRLRENYSLSSELHPDQIEKAISNYGVEGYYNKEWMKLAYLLDNGKKVKVPMKMKDYGDMSETIIAMAKDRGLKVSDIQQGGFDFYNENKDFVEAIKNIVDERKLSNLPEDKRAVARKLFGEKEMRFAYFDTLISAATRMEYDLEHGGLQQILDRTALRETIEKKVKTNNADYNKWVDNLFDGIVEKYGIRNDRDWYSPSGNLRPWGQLYNDVTPENILRYMLAQSSQGGSGGLFDSNIMGAAAETYGSIEEIREKGKKRLRRLEEGEYDEWSNSITERVSNITYEFLSPSQKEEFGSSIDAMIAITNAVAKDKTANGIYKEMKSEYPRFTMDNAKELEAIVKEIQEQAIGYFEAKPQRIVSLSEVRKAVVPSNVSEDILEGLQNNGIEIATYKKGNEASRKRVIKKESEGIRFRFIGERGARNLDKAEEATTRLDNLSVAREMEAAEKDAKTIKMATGWERGADGLWRYEVDDNLKFDLSANVDYRKRHPEFTRFEDLRHKYNAYLFEIGDPLTEEEQKEYDSLENEFGGNTELHRSRKLKDYVDAPELFEAYPELRNIDLSFVEMNRNTEGKYLPNAKSIQLNENIKFAGQIVIGRVLVHEIQHAIQHIEGFEPGANENMQNPNKVQQKASNIEFMQKQLDKHIAERNELLKKKDELNDKMSAWYDSHDDATAEDVVNDKDMRQWNREYDAIENELENADRKVSFDERWLDAAKNANTKLGYEGYRRVSGEVEARNVSRRMMLSADDRRNMLAVETEDVAREDQIFLMDGMESGISVMRFRIANQNQEIFVSNAQKAVEGIKQEKATPQQWLAMIEKNGGLKSGEDKWLGLSDWLKDSDTKTITKSEILDFINQNKIQIEEVKYGEGLSDYSNEKLDQFNAEFEELMFEGEEVTGSIYTSDWVDYAYEKMVDSYGDDFRDAFELEGTGTSSHLVPTLDWNDELSGAARFFLDVEGTDRPINNTRLGYTTEGLENKAEIALTVPTIESWNESDEIHFGDAGDGRAIAWIRFGETFVVEDDSLTLEVTELKEPYRDVNGLDIYKTDSGRSTDFIAHGKGRNGEMIYVAYVNGEQIPVAHKTLEDAKAELNKYFKEHPIKGEKRQSVLVIDEIQSKRHQEGREKGYAKSEANNAFEIFREQMMEKYGVNDIGNIYKALNTEERNEFDRLRTAANEEFRNSSDVPAAPFEKNWHELAFKRMLRYAAENGFNKVAWTTGAQQAERYNISKFVDNIRCNRVGKNGNKSFVLEGVDYNVVANNEGVVVAGSDEFKGKQLFEIVGGSLAEKMLKMEEGDVINNTELRIGGEGMKGFYDKMLPSFVNKYVKKWGTKVQDIELPELEEAGHIMHSVDVTEAMKESVMEGQTMFRIAPQEQVQAEVDKFTSKYNGKEVVVLNSTVSDEKLESLGLDVEDVREAIEKETEGFYDPITDKIYIFADIADADELEKTLFHENGHGIFRKNKKFVNEFNENSKDKFKNAREVIKEYYKEHERAEELFVRIFEQELSSGEFKYLPKYLSEDLWNEFDNILKEFGYDRQEESDRRRKRSVVRTETNRGSEKEATMRNGSVEPNQREERKEKGRSKEQAERLKKLFDDVADMGLRGVLGNTNYDLAMLDIFYALPEKARTDVAVRAVKIGGDVAVAVDEYLKDVEEPTLLEKVIASITNALRKVGINVELTENDVKYLLWRSRKPLDRNSIFDMAEDIDMRRKLKVGEFDNDPTDGGDTPGGGTRFRRVYHGSGASFDKFDHSFMGTGEGNQSFGWGTYVTDVKGIGENYGTIALRGKDMFEYIGDQRVNRWVLADAKQMMDRTGGYDEMIKLYGNATLAPGTATEQAVNFLKSTKKEDWEGQRHFYEVEIPDNDGTNYIAWDKMLPKEQAERIKDAVRNSDFFKAYEKEYGRLAEERLDSWTKTNGGRAYKLLGNFTHMDQGADKAISQLLSKAGFVGFEYPANYMSGGNDFGQKNYVIFDEKDLDIKEHTRFRVTPKMDAEYSKAVESGNTKKVLKLVKDAAKAAMPNTKVVDRYGNPRIVYHGTVNEEQFNVFNKERSVNMFFFTSSEGNAREYTHKRRMLSVDPRQSGRIMPCFLNIENPLVIDANRRLWNNLSVEWSEYPVDTRQVAEYAKKNGYDGVIINKLRDHMFNNDTSYADVFIAFEPEQIKSVGVTYEKVKRWHFPWDEYDQMNVTGVTYDDNGNLIPLSERFNPEKNDIRFRVAKEQIDIADERTEIIKKYDKELESKMFNFQEAFQDRMLSLKVLMDLIENETGKKAKSFEDAYTAENQLGSINRPAQLKWLDEFYKPLLEELNKLSKKYGQKEIERYIYCKSGLERNEVLRQRDADETYEAAKAELDEKLAKNQIDQAQYQILLQQADDERKKTLATDTDYSGIRGLLMNTRADDLYDQYVRGVITEAKYKQEVADLKKNEEKVIKDWKQFAENQVTNIEKKAEKAELDALWDKINAATNETLRIDFESGMIDRDTYNAEKKMMKYYVPLRNWENTTAEEMYEYRHDMTQAVSSNQKRAKGRKSQADNPIATIALMAQNAIVRGNRNKMKQKLYSFVANRETSLASVRNVWYVRNVNNQWEPQYADTSNAKTEAEIKQIMEQFELDMQKLEAQGDAFKGKLKQGMNYRANRKQKDEHVVTVMINGKEYGIYINGNPRAAQAVNGLTNAEGIDDAGKWIDNLKRYYGAGLTSWNPDFIIPNFVRDSIHAATMTFLDKGALAAAKYIWNTPKVLFQVFKEVSGKGVNDPKLHQYFEEFVANGGETGYTAIHTLEDYKKEYDKLMNEAKGVKDSMKNGLKEGISKLSSILEAANRIAEDVNRFNAYVTSREEGYDIVKSIDAAKNITVNFNRKGALASNTTTFGKVASLMSRWILFFNPGVQGIYQLVTKSKLNPKRAKTIGATILASGFFMPMINELLVAAAGGDDEDDYWNQTDFKRRNNWMLFTGDGYVTIPLPPVLRELYGIGDIMYGIMTGHITPGKAIYDTLKQIQGAVGFVNLLPEVSHEPDMITYVKGFAPDVAAPILDIVTNTNFMGSPIAKWTDYNEFDPEYMRVYKGVSPVWKELSMLLNEVGGEEGLRSNVWGNFINPAMMEHLITSYTGGIGKTINNVIGMALDDKENIDLFRKSPILPRFYTPNDEKTVQPAINRKYYDFDYEYNRYSKALKKYEKAIESGEHPEWQKHIDEMEKDRIIEFINYFKAESKVLKKLTDKLKVDSQNKELESDVYDKKAEIATNSFRILRGN